MTKYLSGLYFVFVGEVAGTPCYKCGATHGGVTATHTFRSLDEALARFRREIINLPVGCAISVEESLKDGTLRKIAGRGARGEEMGDD